jgi:hypothetical protein
MNLTRTRKEIIIVVTTTLLMLAGPGWAADVKPPIPPPAKPQTPAAVTTAQSAGIIDVKFDKAKGFLSVKAEKADLTTLLKKIGEVMALPVEIGTGVSGTVTLSSQGKKPEEVVDKILAAAGEKNFLTEYSRKPGAKKDDFLLTKITVVKKGVPRILEKDEKEVMAGMDKREREYQELFARLDKEKNKIARALKEYMDPKTTRDEKIKLRTYFRQTPIDEPEDKLLLKGVTLDPYYGELIDDLQMALLHAIQDRPEESDKEYILDMLRKNQPPGWLMYAMYNVWDERYIPYLLQYVKRRSCMAIEVLGEMKVKEAVPYLEEALKDKDGGVAQAAFDSLYQITGKKYEYRFYPPKIKSNPGGPANQGRPR